MKHFLKETDFGRSELEALFRRAREFKATRGRHARPLEGQTWALLFSKSSTRTRVSFEVAMGRLGGRALYLSDQEVGIGRRDPTGLTPPIT
mgnify:CR=1 FL=1